MKGPRDIAGVIRSISHGETRQDKAVSRQLTLSTSLLVNVAGQRSKVEQDWMRDMKVRKSDAMPVRRSIGSGLTA